MCTAILHGSFAGRNLDVDCEYGESVIIVPKNYPFVFRKIEPVTSHYAMIGMGIIRENYPLYFDAANECGLYCAGLNYLGNAKYSPVISDRKCITPYELIPYILSSCSTVKEAEYELQRISLADIPFSADIPLAELHFFIADRTGSIVVEPDADGLKVYENPTGVLTNNPPFPIQLFNLNNYMSLTSEAPENRFSASLSLSRYSFGMGALGLPGDLSSQSRFVRAAFHRANSASSVNLADIMHLLDSVAMPKGSVRLGCRFEYTEYTSAVDLTRLIYSYRTYESPITYAVRLSEEYWSGEKLFSCELKREKEPYLSGSSYNMFS